MKAFYLGIYLLLISIVSFASINVPLKYVFNTHDTSLTFREDIKIINNTQIKTIDEKFLYKFDSIARINNSRDTIYFSAIKSFLKKDISQYRKDKIYEAKIKLYWPILALVSMVLLTISIQRKEGPLQLLALALLVLSLFMTGVNLQNYLLLIKEPSLLYMIL
jgi:hypothetical protein